MRSSSAIALGAALLFGCTSTPEPLTYREQLDVYKDMKIRLYKVGTPVQKSGAKICAKTKITDGIQNHDLSDYPEDMHEVANSYWDLTEEQTKLSALPINGSICAGTLVLSYEKKLNAWTDGDDIFITANLLKEVNDLALALIIAHELGHITHGDIWKEPSEELEQKADRFALFMLTRAGLDYKKAALQDVASRQPHSSNIPTVTDTKSRAEHFRNVVAEIEKLEAASKALIP